MSSPILTWLQGLSRTPVIDDQKLITRPWLQQFSLFASSITQLIQGTHAQRLGTLASNYANGSLYEETDRGSFYIAINGVWYYLDGLMKVTQDSLPTDLSTDTTKSPNPDDGFEVYVSDYAHQLMWGLRVDGTYGWMWGEAELGSDYMVTFLSGPDPATGWHLCDGSNSFKLNSDGTISVVTLPNVAGTWYRQ
jgi:hypothetical protein